MRAACIALWILATVLVFGFGFLVGVGRGMDAVQQQAVDEGYAVRDPDFRWRSSDELVRRPARRAPEPKE